MAGSRESEKQQHRLLHLLQLPFPCFVTISTVGIRIAHNKTLYTLQLNETQDIKDTYMGHNCVKSSERTFECTVCSNYLDGKDNLFRLFKTKTVL